MAHIPIAVLKSRIKTTESIRKITKAQEIIAAAHVIRARDRLSAVKPYADELSRTLTRLTSEEEIRRHPLLRPHVPAPRVAIVMVTTDRGQCGSHNSQIFARTDEMVQELRAAGRQAVIYTIGKKGRNHCIFRGYPIAGSWPAFGLNSRYSDFCGLNRELVDAFLCGSRQWGSTHAVGSGQAASDIDGADEIYLVHNQFISSLRSAPRAVRLLPLGRPTAPGEPSGGVGPLGIGGLLQCEPNPSLLLDSIGRAHLRATIHSALVEACAAEISARRIAMKSATDNANTRIDSLRLAANRSRQDQITEQVIEDSRGGSPFTDHDAR